MAGYYPPWGFYYKVEFGISKDSNDAKFQTVSGLGVEYDTESFKEGGENRFEHKLPVRTKYSDLSLKRGLLKDSKVIAWCLQALQDRTIQPKQVNVTLLNEQHAPLLTWAVSNAWPRKWQVSDFNAQGSSLVIETLDLSYDYFTCK